MSGKLTIRFITPGLFTSIQDQGRIGYQHMGIPYGGALDKYSYKLANNLVGNPENTPVLEITYIGPKIHFNQGCTIAICGADLSAQINSKQIVPNSVITVQTNDILSFGKPNKGCRAYLAIQGTWHVKKWLKSTSPLVSSDILTENLLVKNQILDISTSNSITKTAQNEQPNTGLHLFPILPGPEFDWFDEGTTKAFQETEFEVSNQVNRMGIRLSNKIDNYHKPLEMISSGIITGTIQITHEGQPVILLADAQTTGGYPRIANVKENTLDQLAQLRPRDRVKFHWT